MTIRCFLLLFFFLARPVQAGDAWVGTVTYVADGDTLWVRPQAGGSPQKLRLDGIDAPEHCQLGGRVSHEFLAQRTLHRQVRVTVRQHDSYGRGLARIELDGHDLGAQLVLAGQAWSYRWRHHSGPYAAEETAARQARRGVFAGDHPELPRDFRKRNGSCHPDK